MYLKILKRIQFSTVVPVKHAEDHKLLIRSVLNLPHKPHTLRATIQRMMTLTILLMLIRPTRGENRAYKLSFIKCLSLFLSFFNKTKKDWDNVRYLVIYKWENFVCGAPIASAAFDKRPTLTRYSSWINPLEKRIEFIKHWQAKNVF